MGRRFQGRSSSFFQAVKRVLADYALEHTGLKFLALLLALLLWFSISNQVNSVTTLRNVPIEFLNIPDGMQIRGAERDAANVKIRGLRDALGDLQAGFPRLSLVADLKGFQPGKRVVTLTPGDVVSPPNIEVLSVEPSRFSITVERTTRATIRVAPAIEGSPPEGYDLIGVDVFPPSVTVSGPESVVRKLKNISTETISLNGKTSEFTTVADIDLSDPSLELIDSAEVSVKVNVRPSQQAVELGLLPVTVIPHAERAKAAPSSVQVILKGDQAEIENIRRTQLLVIANVTGLPRGEHTISPVVQMPDSIRSKISAIKINPETVKVTIR